MGLRIECDHHVRLFGAKRGRSDSFESTRMYYETIILIAYGTVETGSGWYQHAAGVYVSRIGVLEYIIS